MKKILIAALFATLLFPSCGDDDKDDTTPQNNNTNETDKKPNEVVPTLDDSENKQSEDNTKPTQPVNDETEIVVNEDLLNIIQNNDEYAKMNVFLCFGQSNMEGNASVGSKDKLNVPDNFKNMVVANCDVEHYKQERYTWRTFGKVLHWTHPCRLFCTHIVPVFARGRRDWHYHGGNWRHVY